MRGLEDAPEQIHRHRTACGIEHRGRRRKTAHAAAGRCARLMEVRLHEMRATLADDGVRLDRRGIATRVGEHEDAFGEKRPVVLAEETHDILDRGALSHRPVDQVARKSRQTQSIHLDRRSGKGCARLRHPLSKDHPGADQDADGEPEERRLRQEMTSRLVSQPETCNRASVVPATSRAGSEHTGP